MADFTQYNTLFVAHCEIDRDITARKQHAKMTFADLPPLPAVGLRKLDADQGNRQSSIVLCKEYDPVGVWNGNDPAR
jgi:hypothetical protein